MVAQLNPLSPISKEALGRLVRLTGATAGVDKENRIDTSSGAVTLLLPTVYADDTIVLVRDVGGVAGTNEITIDGNGELIDGSATFSLNWNRGVVAIGRDAEGGGWTKLLAPKGLDGASGDVYQARDVAGVVTTAVQPLIDMAKIGEQGAMAWPLQFSPYTCGCAFNVHTTKVLTGIRLWMSTGAGARSLKCTLWRNRDGARLYDETIVFQDNAITSASFAAPYSVPPEMGQGGTAPYGYFLTVCDVTGGAPYTNKYAAFPSIAGFNGWSRSMLPADGVGWMQQPYVLFRGMVYVNAHDTCPTNFIDTAHFSPVMPIIAP